MVRILLFRMGSKPPLELLSPFFMLKICQLFRETVYGSPLMASPFLLAMCPQKGGGVKRGMP